MTMIMKMTVIVMMNSIGSAAKMIFFLIYAEENKTATDCGNVILIKGDCKHNIF